MSDYLRSFVHPSAFSGSPSQDQLFARICVRPPYFALRHVRLEDGLLIAEASAALPQGYALGPMRPGELSRHGAIAGLCAVALKQRDDQRRYYLATKATFTGFLSAAPYGASVQFAASVTEFGKRRARAFITASHQDERVATLDVEYTILNTTVFERLHASRRQPTPLTALGPVAIREIDWRGNTGTAQIPDLPVAMCAGHFENYPAAPVALLMDQLAQIAERFVDRPCYIAWGEIEATRLCWAGETVTLSMTRGSGDLHETRLHGLIESGEGRAGEMHLQLRH